MGWGEENMFWIALPILSSRVGENFFPLKYTNDIFIRFDCKEVWLEKAFWIYFTS